MFDYYGIKPASFEEEMNMPVAMKQTRNNKIKTIDELKWIVKMAEQMESYYKRIPEEDDQNHADLVQGLTDTIHRIYISMGEALKV